MKHTLTVLLTVGLCLTFFIPKTQAQTPSGMISGQVLDADHQPAIAATVTLLKAPQLTAVRTAAADGQGKFVFNGIAAGEYRIRISAVGSQTYQSEVIELTSAAIELPVINLKAGGTDLKEVSVTAQKTLIEQKIDRTIVNVGTSISNTGATALEALEKAPGVTVDENGNITFKGKTGVLILIDDKPTYLSGDDLANYLRSLPASMLDQIELMPNPPARYDAAGNGGVINLKMKRSKVKGLNGSLSAVLGKNKYYRTNESLNLNYRDGKVNLFANAGFSLPTYYRRLDLGRHFFDNNGAPTSTYTETAYFRNTNWIPSLKTGLDYYVSPKTTLGVVLTGSLNHGTNLNPVNSTLANGAGQLDSAIIADNSTHSSNWNGGINLNYSHQYDSLGKALTFDLDYLRYSSARNQDFLNHSYNAAGALAQTQHITDNLPAEVNIFAAKTDYTLPLPGKAQFAAGLKTSFVNTDNAANYFNVMGATPVVDNNNTNHFLYHENINAAYMSFNRDWKRVSLQAGLRAEQTNVQGHQLGNAISPDSAFTQHYTSLFPTTYLLYKLDTAGKHTLKASYGRRIDRPYYQDLNPFVTILDKYSQFTGNPFLKPQFAAEYELTYSYRDKFSMGFTYHKISGYQVEYDFQRGSTFVATTINLGERPQYNVNATLNLDPAKWWSFNFYTELVQNTYIGQLGSQYIDKKSTYFYFNYNNQLTLGNGYSAELGMFYMSPFDDSQFSHIARQQVSGGLAKKVLHNKGSVKFAFRDLFQGNYSAGNINNIPNAVVTYHNYNANRSFTIGFNYSFGKNIDIPKKRKTGSADAEKDRVGN